jgi:hypothetical protein
MVDQIHEIIRQDLLRNQLDLLNLQHHYTHKYRSQDRLLDINVGIYQENLENFIVQIYVADKNTRIREKLLVTKHSKVIDTDIIIKRK